MMYCIQLKVKDLHFLKPLLILKTIEHYAFNCPVNIRNNSERIFKRFL